MSTATWGRASWWRQGQLSQKREEKPQQRRPSPWTCCASPGRLSRSERFVLNRGAANSGIRHQRVRQTEQQSFPSAALIKQLISCELRWMCCCRLWVWGLGPSQNKGKGTDLGSVGMKLENWFDLARFSPLMKDFTSFTGHMNLCYSNLSLWSHLSFQTLSNLRHSVFCVLIHLPLAACGFPKADFSSRRDPLRDLSCLPESWKYGKRKMKKFSILRYFIMHKRKEVYILTELKKFNVKVCGYW